MARGNIGRYIGMALTYVVLALISLYFFGIGVFLIYFGRAAYNQIGGLLPIFGIVFGSLTAAAALLLLTFRRISRVIILVIATLNTLMWSIGALNGVIYLMIKGSEMTPAERLEQPFPAYIIFAFLSLISCVFLLLPKTKRLFK
ncbi:MAG: hypothetical protein M1548_06430 [Actinobacteria bacterium]|nr:hypothetical protein [Actinomycetota bacterium]